MMRRLLEEEVAAAPAPATEEPMLEGEAIMRAVQEAGFELTPEEIALLELETVAAAPAPAGELGPALSRDSLRQMPGNWQLGVGQALFLVAHE